MRKRVNKFCIVILLIKILMSTTNVYAAMNITRVNSIINETSSTKSVTENNIITDTTKEKAEKNTPKVDASRKVYDYANLLTEQEENSLSNDITKFIGTYHMDMVIVTISENNKKSSMEYADDFYDYNDFGIGDSNDGLLFLMDMDKRVMWISTTGYAIKIYNDARINSILDDTYNKISKKDYYGCASEFIKSSSYFADEGVITSNNTVASTSMKDNRLTLKKVVYVIIPSSMITIIFIIIGVRKHRNVKEQKLAKGYRKNLNINVERDQFISKHTSRVRIESSTSSGSWGGGGSGSSSTHSGSSGVTHGGGGRSF